MARASGASKAWIVTEALPGHGGCAGGAPGRGGGGGDGGPWASPSLSFSSSLLGQLKGLIARHCRSSRPKWLPGGTSAGGCCPVTAPNADDDADGYLASCGVA